MARSSLNKRSLLQKLDKPVYDADSEEQQLQMNQMNLAKSLSVLAEMSHETEFSACESAAAHLLGAVPEPDDVDLLADVDGEV
jgi:hypothetical protein